ncbi:MAG: hypothetical protein AAF543_01265 [Pseudomonadota bacterium]
MSEVRHFTRNDVAEISDLFAEVFLHDQPTDIDDLRSHFEAVYFDTPFRDDDCPSLVYANSSGRITAFLGVLPRSMRFKDERIKAAIAGNLMIRGAKAGAHASTGDAAAHSSQLAPAALVKAFFRCPYDIALTDSANEPAKRIWERAGGQTLRLYSFRWLKVLKPVSFGLDVLERRGRLRPLVRMAGPLGPLLDRTTGSLVSMAEPSVPKGCMIEQLEAGEIIDQLENSRLFDLAPSYTEESFGWIMTMAKARRRCGELRARRVRDSNGQCLGWMIYAGAAGEVGQVLQLYAQPATIDRVFDCLLADAAEAGVSALSGKVDPLFVDVFSKRQCHLRVTSWSLAQSERQDLLRPFLVGNALFSELESEGWTRFLNASLKGEFERIEGAV